MNYEFVLKNEFPFMAYTKIFPLLRHRFILLNPTEHSICDGTNKSLKTSAERDAVSEE